jgi:hypothetical protein
VGRIGARHDLQYRREEDGVRDLKIVRLEVENVKRISAAHIKPGSGAAVVIAGQNEQGKSSVLDSIAYVLGGEKLVPSHPLRAGQKKGKIVADLDDYLVTRTFTAAGGGTLTVENREGAKYPSPQAFLGGLVAPLSFDPLSFASAPAKAQAQILRDLVGLDTRQLDADRAEAYDARTEANRSLKAAKARVAGIERPTRSDLAGRDHTLIDAALTAANDADQRASALTRSAMQAESAWNTAKAQMALATDAVEAARVALEWAEARAREAEHAESEAYTEYQRAAAAAETAKLALPDRSRLLAQLDEVKTHNARVELMAQRARDFESVEACEAEVERLTQLINDCDVKKAQSLMEAVFPIEGLGISGDTVLWQGLPLDQASTAIRTRVSVAIGLALMRDKPVKLALIRNGNDLDDKNLAAIAEQVAEAGGQVWIERIAGGNGLQTFVIEDGTVGYGDVAAEV